MKQGKTWRKCKLFNTNKCPPKKDNNESMQTFIHDISDILSPNYSSKKTQSKSPPDKSNDELAKTFYKNEKKINKLCSECNSFVNKYKK